MAATALSAAPTHVSWRHMVRTEGGEMYTKRMTAKMSQIQPGTNQSKASVKIALIYVSQTKAPLFVRLVLLVSS